MRKLQIHPYLRGLQRVETFGHRNALNFGKTDTRVVDALPGTGPASCTLSGQGRTSWRGRQRWAVTGRGSENKDS